jgi:hypothetical protein
MELLNLVPSYGKSAYPLISFLAVIYVLVTNLLSCR